VLLQQSTQSEKNLLYLTTHAEWIIPSDRNSHVQNGRLRMIKTVMLGMDDSTRPKDKTPCKWTDDIKDWGRHSRKSTWQSIMGEHNLESLLLVYVSPLRTLKVKMKKDSATTDRQCGCHSPKWAEWLPTRNILDMQISGDNGNKYVKMHYKNKT